MAATSPVAMSTSFLLTNEEKKAVSLNPSLLLLFLQNE